MERLKKAALGMTVRTTVPELLVEGAGQIVGKSLDGAAKLRAIGASMIIIGLMAQGGAPEAPNSTDRGTAANFAARCVGSDLLSTRTDPLLCLGMDPLLCLGMGPLLCLGMGLTSIFSEGLYAATTFGPAITFNIGWQICYMLGLSDGRLTEVALNMAYAEVCSGALQVVLLRRSVSLPLVAAIVIPGCGFLVFGQLLMLHVEGGFTEGGAWLKRSLGGVLLLMFAQRILALALAARRRPAEPDLQGSGRLEPPPPPPAPMARFFTWRVQLSTFWWFGLSGVVGGLTSVQGPPIMMWVSIHAAELNFDAWRASNAVLRVGINVTRLSIFALRGRVHIDQTYPLALSMIGGGCVGLLVGNRAAFLFRDTATLQVRVRVRG